MLPARHPDSELDPRFYIDVAGRRLLGLSAGPRSRLACLASGVFRSSPDFARLALLHHGREGYLHQSARR